MIKRRMMALLLLLSMVFANVAGSAVFAADISESEYEEYVEDPQSVIGATNSDYSAAINLLKDLKLIDVESKATTVMTRGEFAEFILSVLNIDANLENVDASQMFIDVPSEHPNFSSILAVYNMGLMNGVGNKKFEPDAELTYEQTIKVLVCALGYELLAGNNPMIGYISKATELKILSGITEAYTAPATLGVVSQIIKNSLEVKMLRPVKQGQIIEYSTQENKTILEVNDIVKVRNILTETYITGLSMPSNLKSNQVKIGGIIYYIGATNATNYLGYSVEAYVKRVKEGADYSTILHISPYRTQNEILKITDSELVSIAALSNMSKEITYRVGLRSSKATLKRDANIIYQGIADNNIDITKEYSSWTDAIIELIDNDNDGFYDIMFIKDYTSMVVEKVSKASYTVMGDFGGEGISLAFNPSNTDVRFKILKENQEIGINDIKTDDVLSYTESKMDKDGKKYIEAIVNTNSFRGSIESIAEENNTQAVVINSNEYLLARKYAEKKEFILGESGTFFVAFNDKIVGFKTSGPTGGYAYVIAMRLIDNIDQSVALKVIDHNGEIRELETVSNIYYNKSKTPGASNNKIAAKEIYNNAEIKEYIDKNVIQFAVNGEGKIIEILDYNNPDQDAENGIAIYRSPAVDEAIKTGKPTVRRQYSKNVPLLFVPEGTFLGGEDSIMLDSAAIIFNVPSDADLIEDHRFSVVRAGGLNHQANYDTEIFNVVKKMGKSKLVVIRYGGSNSSNDDDKRIERWATPAFVESVMQTVDSNGLIRDKVTLWGSGGKVEYMCADDIYESDYYGKNNNYVETRWGGGITVMPSALKRGDLISFNTNSDGEIRLLNRIIEFNGIPDDDWTFVKTPDNNMRGEPTWTLGRVEGIEGGIVQLWTSTSAGKGVPIFRHFDTRGLPITIYETSMTKSAFRMGTIDDVEIGDFMYMRSSDAWATNVLLYKK